MLDVAIVGGGVSRIDLLHKSLKPLLGPSPKRILLANSENLTPQPPSLRGKGELESPSPLRGGVWGGVRPPDQFTNNIIDSLAGNCEWCKI